MYRLGKKAARIDNRVPYLAAHKAKLPPPPADVNWYADIGSWPMLLNDQYGDCVEAAVLHCIQQMSAYAGAPLMPVDEDALTFYEGATGFNPADPNSDQGSYVMGPGGVTEYWHNHGVTCGGVLNKVTAVLQLRRGNMNEFQQGVYIFGGCLTGIQLPEAIMAGDSIPAVWSDFNGPVAGGHEIWIDGYQTLNSGRTYDLISWGQRYRCTEEFLQHVMDEAVVVVDPAEINARGVDGAGLSMAQLTADMAALA
jgi:hypothetical protein